MDRWMYLLTTHMDANKYYIYICVYIYTINGYKNIETTVNGYIYIYTHICLSIFLYIYIYIFVYIYVYIYI